jgi:hypothetical protein
MGFLTFIVKRGRLSEVDIDVDKDWQTKGITNIKQVAESMAKGDLMVKDTTILVRIATGPDGYVLTSRGAGKLPTWAPAGGALKYYFPVLIESTHSEAKVSVAQSILKDAPVATDRKYAYGDAPADYIKRLTPAIALVDAEAVVTPDKTGEKTPTVGTGYKLKIPVGGAVADDGGVQTDETVAAQNPAANDMHLLPAIPALNDAYYFGHAKKFDVVWLNIGTQGDGVWTITWEYWNGAAWAALSGVVDNTNGFTTVAGLHDVSFTMPGDWATTDVGGVLGLYWIRGRVSSYTSVTTQPLGSQAWVEIFV